MCGCQADDEGDRMFMRMIGSAVSVGALALALGGVANAQVWDEDVDGDLSDDPDAPTPLVFAPGANTIVGSMQSPDDTRDFITFTVMPGQQLTGLLLQRYIDLDTGGDGDRGFHAINEGPTSFIPGPDTADLFLGGAHLDPAPPGTDLLPVLGMAPQAGTGFEPPLGPGTYSYVVQQTGPELTGYTLDFVIEADGDAIGGEVRDTFALTGICRNLTSGQTTVIPGLGGGPDWDCTGAGFMADFGDTMFQAVVGVSSCGADPCDVGGSVTGMMAFVAICRNLTTGQIVQVPVVLNGWSCSNGGFVTANGDQTLQVVVGIAGTMAPEIR